MPTTDDVIDALRGVLDPELHRSIVELDLVRASVRGSTVDLEIALVIADTAEVKPSGEKGSAVTPVFYLWP